MVRILDNLRISYTLSAQREALLTTLALGTGEVARSSGEPKWLNQPSNTRSGLVIRQLSTQCRAVPSFVV